MLIRFTDVVLTVPAIAVLAVPAGSARRATKDAGDPCASGVASDRLALRSLAAGLSWPAQNRTSCATGHLDG